MNSYRPAPDNHGAPYPVSGPQGDDETSPEPGTLFPMDIVLYSENGPHVEVLFRSPDDRDRLRWAMERAMPDMHSWRYLEKNAARQHLGAGEAGESVEDALHES